MSNISCPACCSTDVISFITSDSFENTFGDKITIEVVTNRCFTCDSSGDFANQNSSKISMALKELDCITAKRVIEKIKRKHPTKSVDIRLGLEIGTLDKWELNTSKIPKEGLFILKVLNKDLTILERNLSW